MPEYMNPPRPGSILSVKYDEIDQDRKLKYKNALPVYIKLRPDLQWQDLKKKCDNKSIVNKEN